MTSQPLDLDPILARAGHLYEYVQQPDEADVLAGTDVPQMADEIRRLRAELATTRTDVLRNFLWRLEQSSGDATAAKFLDNNSDLSAGIDEMAASLRGDGFSNDEIADMLGPGVTVGEAPEPTPLRWGLDDVMYGDDDSTIVMLSGPAGEPYWLELDPERTAVLRQNLAGPAAEEAPVVADDSSNPDRCGARHHQYPDTVCTEPASHYIRELDPHAGPLIINGRECGGAAWDEPERTSR